MRLLVVDLGLLAPEVASATETDLDAGRCDERACKLARTAFALEINADKEADEEESRS